MPCGWGVKAGMVRVWVAGKTVWSPCYMQAISERFTDKELIYKVLYKSAFFYFFKNKSATKKAADSRHKTEVYIKSDTSFQATTEHIQQWQTTDPHVSSNSCQTKLVTIIICKKLSILPQHHNFRHVGSTGQVMLSLSAIIGEGLPSTVLVPGAELQKPYPVNWAPTWFTDLSSSHRFFQFCMVHFLFSSTWHNMGEQAEFNILHYTLHVISETRQFRPMCPYYQFIRIHLAFCIITYHINKQHCTKCTLHCYMLLQLGKLFFSTDVVQQLTRTWDNIWSDTFTSVVRK